MDEHNLIEIKNPQIYNNPDKIYNKYTKYIVRIYWEYQVKRFSKPE